MVTDAPYKTSSCRLHLQVQLLRVLLCACIIGLCVPASAEIASEADAETVKAAAETAETVGEAAEQHEQEPSAASAPAEQEAVPAAAPAAVFDLNLDIMCVTFSGQVLADSGYEWADKKKKKNTPIFFIPVPTLSASLHSPQPQRGQPMKLVSFAWNTAATITPVGIGGAASGTISLTPLLSLMAAAGVNTGWNYGKSLVTMATYNPAKQEYESDMAFSEVGYSFAGSAVGIVPLPAANMVQLSYTAMYTGYTGAEKGEPWKCGMAGECVNGWSFKTSVMAAHNFRQAGMLKMMGISVGASGWYTADDWDKVYEPYNPTYVTFSITPMARLMPARNQMIMAMANVNRERKFESDDFKTSKTLSQVYDGSRWRFKNIMVLWHIQLL